ncbi:alpha/beta hydrolase [Nonomuraea sp. NPDC003804]|uniref:alpha/beta hydrolase n=1 Tax=Nonomuraea sp. NPDC003804 TaxID=3154547 RepID=UPI0033BDF094
MVGFQHAVRHAAEVAGILDEPARALAAQAWVGGGAPAFAAELARQRAALVAALESALRRIAAEGDAVPSLGRPATALSAVHGSFAGVEPAQLRRLISGLTIAADELPRAAAGLGAPEVAAIGAWAAAQAGDLRRRLTLILRDGGELAPAPLVAFGLYGGHAPSTVTVLLNGAAAGDTTALARLLDLQRQAADPTLAARVSAWWRMLDSTARDQALKALPAAGFLDGLPMTVRDRANRALLATEKARLAALLTTVPPDPHLALTWPAVLDRVMRELDHVKVIEQGLAQGGRNGRPPAYLLSFDVRSLGEAAISFGDPDTADRVVTYVPGMNTRLASFHEDLNRAAVLWDQAHYFAPGRKIASIAWLGYRAPQIDWQLTVPGQSVATDGAADTGARALASLVDGLRASHDPSGKAKLTMLGHSYGSLVTGKAALLRHGRFADELVFVGSPGVGVRRAEELGVGPGRVWAGEAAGDPVGDLARFGNDPGDDSFGARRFYVEDGPFYLTFKAHSDYWNDHSQSLRNLAHIVNAEYHRVTQNAGEQP